jgi:glycine betaine catabolism A
MATFLKANQLGTQGALTLPGHSYTSPEIYARELERIFHTRWLCAARADEIPERGDFLTREIGVESLIITRDNQGKPHAFFNVCRHRGTRMCEAAQGKFGDTITWPYHAWSYTLDGRLYGAPHMSGFEGFDKNDYPLHEAALAEWKGFLFINLSSDPEPFERAWQPLLHRFDRFHVGALRLHRRIEYEIAANWKLIHQNYSECYHCSPVHPQLVKLTPPTSGVNDLTEGPFLGGLMDITAPGGSLTESGAMCGVPISDAPPDGKQVAWYYSVFPNMLLSLLPDYALTHILWPISPTRTKLICEWLFHPETLASGRFDPDDAVRFWDEVNRQDWHVSELSQLGVASKVYAPSPYSPREGLAVQFDKEVRRALSEG